MSALEHVELSLIMPSAAWADRCLIHVAFLMANVEPAVQEFGYPGACGQGQLASGGANAGPVYGLVAIVGHIVFLVFLEEVSLMFRFHHRFVYCFLIFSCYRRSSYV